MDVAPFRNGDVCALEISGNANIGVISKKAKPVCLSFEVRRVGAI
jgi:hypothetical protein